MHVKGVLVLFLAVGLVSNSWEVMASRSFTAMESEAPFGAMVAGASNGDKVTAKNDEGSTIFLFDEESEAVAEANKVSPNAGITHLLEIRSKLKFKGNKIQLKNPEMVPKLIGEIKSEEAQFPDSKFLFCVHVGTTADERVHTKKKGFMEGRIKTVKDAVDGQLGGEIGATFQHLKTTRFAALVMKVYTGSTAPACAKEDIVPPAAGAKEEEIPEAFVAGIQDTDKVTTKSDESSTIFLFEEDSGPVALAREANPDSDITNLLEIRSKLRYKGNKIELKNPEMVPKLIDDIKNEADQYPGSKFLFCLHVGTTGDERIHTKKKGFMEGRIKTVKDAVDGQLGGDIGGTFEHLKSTRFAGFVMKVYSGSKAPDCAKEDLIPPVA